MNDKLTIDVLAADGKKASRPSCPGTCSTCRPTSP